jgi:hypothetical protein
MCTLHDMNANIIQLSANRLKNTFRAVIAALLCMRLQPPPVQPHRNSVFNDLHLGLRFALQHTILRAQIAFAFITWLPLSLLLVLVGLGFQMIATLSGPLVQILVPEELRGRVTGGFIRWCCLELYRSVGWQAAL